MFAAVANDTPSQWLYVVETLFRTEGNNGDAFIMRSRVMMLIVAVALGAMIACWSWQLAGPFAAVVATAFYCLDPNILAPTRWPLVKNDISLSLVTVCWPRLVDLARRPAHDRRQRRRRLSFLCRRCHR